MSAAIAQPAERLRERLPCQVCGRQLVPLKDGTARNHVPRRGAEYFCKGSGYHLDRWTVGQRLRHHGGSVWEVIEDRGGWGDYLIRCVIGSRSLWREEWLEAPGREMVAHGEYLHRDGWTPHENPGGETCGLCGRAIEPAEPKIAVRVGGAAPVPFHGVGRCYDIGVQHGTRPIREDAR